MKQLTTALLLAVLCATSCTSVATYQHFVGTDGYELARQTAPGGVAENYFLSSGDSLRITTSYERQRPFLGLQVTELNGQRAQLRGVDPYSGLLVTGTYAKSSARLAGVLPNDVLLSVLDQPVIYREQLAVIEAQLSDQQEVRCLVLRGKDELTLTLRTNLLTEQVTDNQDIRLEVPPPPLLPYAGVQLRGIPRVWAERILGVGKNGVVIAQVEVGSPAWLAGIRGGDLLQTIDGEPVPDVVEASALLARLGAAGQVSKWCVRREVGNHYAATVALLDYSGTVGFGLPFVFHVVRETYESQWSLGLGLLMSNCNRYIADQQTRSANTRNDFSALLDLIHVTTTPDETRWCLLWFLDFEV